MYERSQIGCASSHWKLLVLRDCQSTTIDPKSYLNSSTPAGVAPTTGPSMFDVIVTMNRPPAGPLRSLWFAAGYLTVLLKPLGKRWAKILLLA